jgi:hypothetical protein
VAGVEESQLVATLPTRNWPASGANVAGQSCGHDQFVMCKLDDDQHEIKSNTKTNAASLVARHKLTLCGFRCEPDAACQRLHRTVSMVPKAKAKETKPARIETILAAVQEGRWKSQVEIVRDAYAKGGKEGARHPKTRLPGAIFSGEFSQRSGSDLICHSGVLCADLDDLNEDIIEVRRRIVADPFTLACFTSPTGTGLKVLIPVYPDEERHAASFHTVQQHYKQTYGLDIDPKCGDLSRLCFVSYDPDLFMNPAANVITPAATDKPSGSHSWARPTEKLEDEEPRIRTALQDIPADNYDTWIRVGMALHGWDAQRGFELWDEWSQTCEAKYKQDEMPAKWASFGSEHKNAVTLGTLFDLAKKAGASSRAKRSQRRKNDQTAPPVGASGYIRPEIRVRNDDLLILLEEVWDALERFNVERPRIFRRGGHVSVLDVTDEGDPVIRALSPPGMQERLAEAARWFQIRKKNVPGADGVVTQQSYRANAKPPMDLVLNILAEPRSVLPLLRRIVRAPIMAPSGRIVVAEGYNQETKCWLALDGFDVGVLPDRPGAADISSAVTMLRDELLGDFPFCADADRANTLALFLLPFTREIIGHHPTPLHLIEKPIQGTGAGLLVECLGNLVTGVSPSFMPEARDEDEWRKRITSTLLQGPEIVCIDNLKHRLDSGALSAALTARFWTDRRLGASENVTLPVRCAWVATGNNPTVSGEIARRVAPIRLDPKTDRPWERDPQIFRHPKLLEWLCANRPALVKAALVLIRAWLVAGKPPGNATLGSYEMWATTLGGILEVAGIPGFLGNRERFYDRADRETEAWHGFISAWWGRFGSDRVGVKELWTLIAPTIVSTLSVDPPCDLGKGNDRSQRIRLGDSVAVAVDRHFTITGRSLRIEEAATYQGARQYRLLERKGVDPRECRESRESSPPTVNQVTLNAPPPGEIIHDNHDIHGAAGSIGQMVLPQTTGQSVNDLDWGAA